MTNYFSNETIAYLENSFLKIKDFESEKLADIFDWLSKVPKYTTIRINKCIVDDEHYNESFDELQSFLDDAFQKDRNLTAPKLEIAHDLLRECLVFKSIDNDHAKKEMPPVEELKKKVIVDSKCAQSILRGADIFVPGIISMTMYCKANDLVSVYVDMNSKCLKGMNANMFVNDNSDTVKFLGNGFLLVSRDELFKSPEPIKSGIAVKIKALKDNFFIPSFDLIDNSKYYLQNLPSIICAKVLDSKENELILDMCAAPGGKTTHIAALVNNNSRIIAFDKIPSKIDKMKSMCKLMNAKCVEAYCQDATKIDFNVWKPNSFDRILVDVPCSSLGVRPLVYNEIGPSQLAAYIKYQKSILENAVKLLKPGGFLVYSTCTITLEENEEQISWLVNKHKNMIIVDQEPFHISKRKALKFNKINLNEDQLSKLQRFMPSNLLSDNETLEGNSFLRDTNGFFIAKLHKLSESHLKN